MKEKKFVASAAVVGLERIADRRYPFSCPGWDAAGTLVTCSERMTLEIPLLSRHGSELIIAFRRIENVGLARLTSMTLRSLHPATQHLDRAAQFSSTDRTATDSDGTRRVVLDHRTARQSRRYCWSGHWRNHAVSLAARAHQLSP